MGGCVFFTKLDLRANLEALRGWGTAFEVPDLVDYKDYVWSGPKYAADLHRAGIDRHPRAIEFFPYPKGRGRLRWLSLCDLDDLVTLRSIAGRLAEVVDPQLSSSVHSCRLVRSPPAWRFRKPKHAHERFRHAAAERLLGADPSLPMCVTDVSRYYPSIRLDLLESYLADLGCDDEAVAVYFRFLDFWRVKNGLRGLPIGPEFSAVAGNAFLGVLDHRLADEGISHERYMDDILLFGSGRWDGEEILATLDHGLMELQLLRSLEKTMVVEDWWEAHSYVEDQLLASLSNSAGSHRANTRDRIRHAFHEALLDPEDPALRHFRFVLKFMTNRGDSFAARELSARPSLMNVDPSISGAYLEAVGLDDRRVVDNVMSILEQGRDDTWDGLVLHLLKAVRGRGWGEAEGSIFTDLARDDLRRGPVRAWAVSASHRAPQWDSAEGMDLLEEETDPRVRRALVLGLARIPSRPERIAALDRVRTLFPDMRYTVDWAAAA